MKLLIGKRIRQYREERGMKQEDLAKLTKLSVTYVGMIERGERLPRLDKFIDIVNALEVSPDLLLADVLVARYEVKNSRLAQELEKLPVDERAYIYEIVEAIVRYKQNIN